VSRARRAGLLLTPRAVFQHQTVAGLASVAAAVAGSASEPAESAVGEVPLTPIMHWQRQRGGGIERFNQSLLLRVPAGLREADLRGALQAVLDHHDALRLRFDGAADLTDADLRLADLRAGDLRAVDLRAGDLSVEGLRVAVLAAGTVDA